jgi:hypothetical protein
LNTNPFGLLLVSMLDARKKLFLDVVGELEADRVGVVTLRYPNVARIGPR